MLWFRGSWSALSVQMEYRFAVRPQLPVRRPDYNHGRAVFCGSSEQLPAGQNRPDQPDMPAEYPSAVSQEDARDRDGGETSYCEWQSGCFHRKNWPGIPVKNRDSALCRCRWICCIADRLLRDAPGVYVPGTLDRRSPVFRYSFRSRDRPAGKTGVKQPESVYAVVGFS